jgi:hypothetical protein
MAAPAKPQEMLRVDDQLPVQTNHLVDLIGVANGGAERY